MSSVLDFKFIYLFIYLLLVPQVGIYLFMDITVKITKLSPSPAFET